MALIKCPECGHEVSNKAVSCPNCGFPISHSSRPSNSHHLSKNIQELCVFNGTKSIATPIVGAVFIEVIVGTLLWIGFWTRGGFLVFAFIFGIVFEVMLPFLLVHDIKEICAINRMDGNCLYYDKETERIFIMSKNEDIIFIKPLSKIIQFDGPRTLVITYRGDNNARARFIGGITYREKIIELRKLIGR